MDGFQGLARKRDPFFSDLSGDSSPKEPNMVWKGGLPLKMRAFDFVGGINCFVPAGVYDASILDCFCFFDESLLQ